MISLTEDEYNADIQQARDAGVSERLAALENQQAEMIAKFEEILALLQEIQGNVQPTIAALSEGMLGRMLGLGK
jgi:hypothetical protein